MRFYRSISFWIAAMVVVLIGLVGFMAGRLTAPQPSTVPKQVGETHTLFTTQSASIKGYVASISGNKLKIQNVSGVRGEIEASNNVIIKRPESAVATSTADLKQIEIGREALIALDLSGGVYKVVTINYLPKLPTNFR